MTKNGKRSIYKKPEGDPIAIAVEQYEVMEQAFFEHQKATQVLQLLIDGLTDEEFAEYLRRTQP